MSSKPSPNSVSTKVSLLNVDETLSFTNNIDTVSVTVCNLKKKETEKHKRFKIKLSDGMVYVTRVA